MRALFRDWLIRLVPVRLHPALRALQHSTVAMLWRALSRLPGTSRRFGPPRHVVPTLAAYVTANPSLARYVELHPSQFVVRGGPRSDTLALDPEFERERSRLLPAAGIAVIANGRVLTRSGAIIAPGDQLIADVSSTFRSDEEPLHPALAAARLPPRRRIEATVAVIATFRSGTYYHWLFDTLPRLDLLRQSGIAFDRLVVPTGKVFQRETLAQLGVDPRRIVAPADEHIEASRLVVPSLPGLTGNPPRWAATFLRRSFLPCAGAETRGRKRIFVSRARAGTRRVIGEDELVRRLERRGFAAVTLETLSFAEQVRLFAAADIVVGPHGSGLANIVFCRPGTQVVELFSVHYVNVMYWALANELGLRYLYLSDDGERAPREGRGRRVHADIAVAADRIEATLDKIEAEGNGAAREIVKWA